MLTPFDRNKMKLLINRYDPAFNITPEELSGVLQMPLIGVIPDCREITNVNNGGNSVFTGIREAEISKKHLRMQFVPWQSGCWSWISVSILR